MTVNARALVPAPVKSPLNYGLFSVAEMRGEPLVDGRPDPHWKNGVTWENVCPDASSTYDECVLFNSMAEFDPGLDPPKDKAATADHTHWGATPFTVLVEIDCSPPGFWEDADAIVERTFTEAEQQEVEGVFWTGTIRDIPLLQFPHLASSISMVDTSPAETTLQLISANVGPTGGTPLDVVEALGKLEQAISACVKGVGTIHVPTELLAHLVAQHVLEIRDGVYYSPAGHKISVSSAYPGTAPNGTTTPGVLWMYATGPVFVYRSRGTLVGTREQSLNRSVDTLKRIFERTYVIGYDCCLFGVPVSTGGVVSGLPGSAF